MDKAFDHAFEYVVGKEGSFSDDPEDDGNWTGGKEHTGELRGTKYGISAASYPDMDIVNLSLETAKEIYRMDYWEKAACDALHPAVALAVFDSAVNQGVRRAIKCLQRALGVNDDGKIGPQTRRALGMAEPNYTLERFQAERVIEYVKASDWEVYKRGWMRRVIATAILASRYL